MVFLRRMTDVLYSSWDLSQN